MYGDIMSSASRREALPLPGREDKEARERMARRPPVRSFCNKALAVVAAGSAMAAPAKFVKVTVDVNRCGDRSGCT